MPKETKTIKRVGGREIHSLMDRFNLTRALYGGYFYDGANYLTRRLYNSARARLSAGVSRRLDRYARKGAKVALGLVPGGKYIAPFIAAPRRGKLMTGYLGGKRMKMKKPRKVTKRRYKKAFNGVQFCFERNQIITDQKCVYAEHCTVPVDTVLKYIVYALFKNALLMGGINFTSFEEPRLNRIETGDTFSFTYRTSVTAAPISVGYTVVAGDVTYGNIADNIFITMKANMINVAGGAVGMQSQALLLTFSWLNAGGANKAELNLQDASMSLMTKSSLKMQNRSVNATDDDESDDVNNVPLHGKAYEGRGNGLVPRDYSSIAVPCGSDFAWGLYAAGSVAANSPLAEPPEVYHFQYAKTAGKVSIQPGRIKTSVLNGTLNISLDRFFRLAYSLFTSSVSDTNQYHSLGKVRLFSLERVIAPFAGEVTPAIELAVEHDFKGWLTVSTKRGKYTAPTNIVI